MQKSPDENDVPGSDAVYVHRSDGLRAIGLMCAAIVLFSCLDTTAKYLAAVVQMPATQVVWMRFVSQFILIVMVLGAVRVPSLLRTRKLKHQMLRSFLMLGSTLLNFLAVRHLRLDQTQTIYFLLPLTVALIAGPLLGEWVGWRRMVAILVGFCGILVVVRPGIQAFHIAFVYAFGSMLCYGVFAILTRYLSAYDPAEVTLTYSLIAGAFFMAPFALADWTWPSSPWIWLLLLSTGFWGGVGHYIFIVAHRYAPASTIAPFVYFGLMTHSIAGFLIFGDLPDRWTLVGATIVISSGLYLLHREQVVRQRSKSG